MKFPDQRSKGRRTWWESPGDPVKLFFVGVSVSPAERRGRALNARLCAQLRDWARTGFQTSPGEKTSNTEVLRLKPVSSRGFQNKSLVRSVPFSSLHKHQPKIYFWFISVCSDMTEGWWKPAFKHEGLKALLTFSEINFLSLWWRSFTEYIQLKIVPFLSGPGGAGFCWEGRLWLREGWR